MNKSKTAVVLSAVIEKIQLVLGIVILFLFGICTIMALTDPELAADGFLPVCLVIDVIGVVLIIFSRKRHNLIRRFKDYVAVLSTDPTGSIANLAAVSGTSVDAVRKDLDQMIKKKYFSNAIIDRSMDCIVFINRGTATAAPAAMVSAAAAQAAPAAMKVTVTCKGCGGVNTLVKGQTGECEYCGSVIQG